MPRTSLVAVLVLAALVRDHPAAEACATAPPAGTTVQIVDEEAIIAWDPATKVETFIRRAAFHATTPSFGFLVPTPTTPQLGEVDAAVFDQVATALGPELVLDTSGFSLGVTALALTCVRSQDKSAGPSLASGPPVRVLATARVAGFDASTLEADDPQALADWLGGHGFEATPALTAWLQRYVADHWKLTAFVVATDQADAPAFDLATRAVKMTFQTERPFYPYREPAAPPEPLTAVRRTLRVVVAADARVAATLGDAAWSARTQFARPLDLPPALGLGRRFVTVFVDDSSPRLGTDEVYFAPSADLAEVRATVLARPTRIEIPLDALGAVALVGLVLVRRRRRAR
ncbi:MAG: DUF2330 domain-containing protein [Myxococcales bacterium]|nr:DUF2330 domain-containing protein [Myxococcales bacterium]